MNKKYLCSYIGSVIFLLMVSSINDHANAQSIPILTQSSISESLPILLGPPTNLIAVPISSSEIHLTWNHPSNLGSLVVTGYKIQRSTTGGAWFTVASNTESTSTSYYDGKLAYATTYNYRVFAITALLVSPPSNTATATTFSIPPSPPTGLTARTISSSQINLSWTAPANNGGSAITGYKIERSTNAGSTWGTIVSSTGSTTYSNTGLTSGTTYTYRVSAINSAGTSSPSGTASATTSQQISSLVLVRSGLITTDPLNNQTQTQQQLQANQKYWTYNGDAPAEKAPYSFFKDTKGLHIDVQAPSNSTWAGFFASANTGGWLFHASITDPVRTVPSDYYENGLYVQTGNGSVNYVTCFADTSSFGTVWAIEAATGNIYGATNFNTLWVDPSPNQPLTRDCTIITNGNNYLKVYLDGTMVYQNSTLNLQMPGPYLTFLEPQTSYAGQMLDGTFKDYYVSSDENVKINNLQNNAARVDMVDSSGKVLASSPVSSGTAKLDVGKYHFPLAGMIKTYDSSGTVIASTSGMVNVYGGDVYSNTK